MNRQFSMATRAFLFAFIPLGVTLVATFVIINSAVESRIKDRLRDSLQKTDAARSSKEALYRQRNLKVLSALSENPSLKAAIGLSREADDAESRAQADEILTMQLVQMGGQLDYDLLLIEDAQGRSLAGVVGGSRAKLSFGTGPLDFLGPALLKVHDTLYETVAIPVNLGEENLGSLVLGRVFEFGAWSDVGPAALIADGKILATTFVKGAAEDAQQEWQVGCQLSAKECEVKVNGEAYLALAIRPEVFGDRVRLVSFQSIDAAASDFTRGVKDVFPIIGGAAVLVALLFSWVGSRSIARPLVNLIAQLKRDAGNESPSAEAPRIYQASEVSFLAVEFSKAAGAARESARRLDQATEQFIASMTQALDARDPNTAGHSHRVSVNSAAVARAMGLSADEVEIVRIGAHLHDIGKIGIPDQVLMKPGRLTRSEYELIQRHPQIGKEILEKTSQFKDYLPIVELHHENMDGSGYPYGLPADRIPLGVRIVHVVDVYDAITSDRVYRSAMSDEDAWDLLWAAAGRQFDRQVVEVYWDIVRNRRLTLKESA